MKDGGEATEAGDIRDIKACPFCGSLAEVMVGMRVKCGSCGATGPFGASAAEAIRGWNERVTIERPRAGPLGGRAKPMAGPGT